MVSLITWISRSLVNVVDAVCGSGYNTARRKVAWHPQRYSNTPVYLSESKNTFGALDVKRTMAQSKFPISPERLVEKAKDILASEFGTKDGCDASCLSEDFQFVFPIIGPLSKGEFLKAFGSFKVKNAFPDMKDNSWFQVDPLEPNRVWFFNRATGTHSGELFFGKAIPATGITVESPPQANSLLFNEQGKCYTMTGGYPIDKRIGNTNGLGGMFGILKAIGKPLPFPEAQTLYNPSMRFEAFEHVAKALESMGIDPNANKKAPSVSREQMTKPLLGA